MLNPFTPGATVSVSATTSTARAALTRGSSDQQVMITAPAGGAVTFVKFGDSTVTAAATDFPILPGTSRVFSVPPSITHIAAITGASTQTIYATSGSGQ